jgi:hypothetical protein
MGDDAVQDDNPTVTVSPGRRLPSTASATLSMARIT